MVKYNEKEIVERYLQGETTQRIGITLGTYNTTIRRILKRHKVELRGCSESQTVISSELFTCQSDIRDYWLGFIIADGTIGKIDNLVQIGISDKDEKHLQKYANWLGIPIKSYLHKRFNKNIVRAAFKNKKVRNYLVSIGITPNKSKTIKLGIPLNRDILRGVLDGDGYVRQQSNKAIVEIATASIDFAHQIKDYLESENITISSIRQGSGVYLVSIYKKEEVKKLYTLLYTDAAVFLERKWERFKPLFHGNMNVTNTLNSGNLHRES